MIKKIKENKGITGVDATIAVVILIIFVPLIASLFSNLINIKLRNERKSTALNIAIQMIEGIKSMDYDKVVSGITVEDVLGQTGDLNSEILPKGYTIDTIAVVEKEDTKEVTISVGYIQNNKKESIELSTIISQKLETEEKLELIGEIVNPKSTYEENDDIEYEITLNNIGDITLYNVHISLEKLENQYGETYGTQEWDLTEPLTAGSTEKITTNFLARNGIWDAHFKVTATTQQDGGDTIEYTREMFVYRLTVKDKMIVKLERVNNSQDETGYNLGEIVKFKTVITNTGTSTIKGISIESPSGFEENVIERIEPGETKEVEGYEYEIKEEDIGKGTLKYSVKVTTTEPAIEQTAETTFKVADVVSVLEVKFEEVSRPKEDNTYNYYKDNGIEFMISLCNIGNTSLKNLSVKLYFGNEGSDLYDYSYGWNVDIGINAMKSIRKTILPTDIRFENFTGEKIVFVEIIDENGNVTKSNNIKIKLDNNDGYEAVGG